jgi:hypothetical protein
MGKGLDSKKKNLTTMQDAPLKTPTNTNIKSISTSDPLPLLLTLIDTVALPSPPLHSGLSKLTPTQNSNHHKPPLILSNNSPENYQPSWTTHSLISALQQCALMTPFTQLRIPLMMISPSLLYPHLLPSIPSNILPDTYHPFLT